MRIVTLVENSCGNENCIAEHGLSIYAETEKHKLLLDIGQTDAVVKNAKILGIDLSAVDTVIISHGHYDHSGGILPFSKLNHTAQIIMQRLAAEPHYNGEYPQGNRKLFCLKDGIKTEDDFAHEQCLVITQNGKRWLLSGCAHNGILNILDRYKELFDSYPDYVITGFHMMKREGEHTEEEKAVIIQTAQELSQLDTVFYSHCTGIPAFELMKEIMGDKLIALHSGETVI